MRYVVTGVDGQLSGRIAENMIQATEAKNLIFTCPSLDRLNPEKRARWEGLGVTLRQGNYNDVEELKRAFDGGDRVYIVSGLDINERAKQHINAIKAAQTVGVQHVIYTSGADLNTDEYSDMYCAPDHLETEAYLKQCGMPYNVMGNNLYMENYLTMYAMMAFMSGNKWYSTSGEGRASFIHKDDSARVAAALLLGKGEPGKKYNVCGSESISVREICEAVSEASGITLEYRPVEAEEYYEYLSKLNIPRTIEGDFSKSPVPFCGADIVTNDATIKTGAMDIKSNDVELLTGQRAKTVSEVAPKYSYIWEENVTSYRQIR